jgi:tetratricopeptide (TPR) repeat protein
VLLVATGTAASAFALVLALGAAPASPAGAGAAAQAPHEKHAGHGDRGRASPASRGGAPLFDDLGSHHHPVTTKSKEAQRYFDQGLTLAYAFNHPEAERSFREAARLDPDCAMAWWGAALVLGPNINRPMDPADGPRAWDALQKAVELAPEAKARERAYIEALSKRYTKEPPADRSALDKAYADAMRELHRAHSDDPDAATLFAEALMDTMPWQYWTKDDQPKAETKELLAALEGVLARAPDHPGACHYYIHAVEAVAPEKALAQADRLLTLAPGAGHLVHMPAHIYLRLGLYREATLANELAAGADESYLAQCNAQGFYPATYYPHNVHFLWYTNAMEGRSRASIAAARKIAEHGDHLPLSEADRFAPIVTMALVRFGRWDEVLAEPLPKEGQPFAAAMSHYARGLALAAKGRVDEAERELSALERVAADEKTKALDTALLPGAGLISIARHDLAGHLALARGDHEKALAELRKAVELEDALPYMEPPFSYMPLRHGLGAALLMAGKPREAEEVYREDLRRHPHNGWSLYGLAQSLRAQGKDDLADEVTRRLELAWVRADVKPTSSRF